VLSVCCLSQRDVIDESILKCLAYGVVNCDVWCRNLLLLGAPPWGNVLLKPQFGCSEVLRSKVWFATDVSGQCIGPIFEVHCVIRF
jgi:hypothetical protein